MWKAELCFGDQRVAVKLYAAVEDRKIHFRLLHASDGAPVQQMMVDPVRDEPVEREQMRQGVALERGIYVALSDEERAALEPEPSRAISIQQLVPREAVESRWFDRPYYLGPDGDVESYFALAEALGESGQIAIAHWTMRKKRYQGAVQCRDGYLVLQTLRHTEELVKLEDLKPDAERELDAREQKLAKQLVDTLAGDFEPDEFHDEYRERVRQLLSSKQRGELLQFPAPSKTVEPSSLADALSQSLAARKRAASG